MMQTAPVLAGDGIRLEPFIVGIVIVIAIIGGVQLLLPLVRALARRLDGGGESAQLHDELEMLRARVLDFEPMTQRVAELEERLDFTERMLAASAQPAPRPVSPQEP